MSVTISAQLRANRLNALLMKWVGRLRLGRLLAFGVAGCLGAIGHAFAQLGPAAAQSAPLSWKVVSAGVSLPGYQSPDNYLQARDRGVGVGRFRHLIRWR